jgi:hypothetical protein
MRPVSQATPAARHRVVRRQPACAALQPGEQPKSFTAETDYDVRPMGGNPDGWDRLAHGAAGRPPWSGALEVAPGPEIDELGRRRAELAAVGVELAERELALTAFKAELASFETQYRRALGARYARLDQLTEWLDARRARHDGEAAGDGRAPRDAAGGSDGQLPSGQNWAWVREEGDEPATASRGRAVPERAKRLFRLLARQIHPDLASDPAERERRTNLMVQANDAYERADVVALQRLLDGWERSPDSVVGRGTRAELERVLRRIIQARERLAEIDAEVAGLEASAMGWLRLRVRKAAAEGWDLLAHMARELDRQILEAEDQLGPTSLQAPAV